MGAPAGDGFLMKHCERLDWHTTLPMIVLTHGILTLNDLPRGVTALQMEAIARGWRDLQVDLAKRSPKGELRHATQSDHFIQLDQPEMVIQAIRDVGR
jgi:hypothetical protein